MSMAHVRKDPLEGVPLERSQVPDCSQKRCSHMPNTKSGRRRPSCIDSMADERSFAESRFLNWVSYDRNLAAPGQITNDERLRCPIIWCRHLFDDQNKLLEHVFRCAHYSDGQYWCFHCQEKESFLSCQFKRCQAPRFDKERLSVRVKRLFRSLGNKSQQKGSEALESSSVLKTALSNADNQCSDLPPLYGEGLPLAVEIDGNKTARELDAGYIRQYAELGGFSSPLAELYSENAATSTFSSAESPVYYLDNQDTGSASQPVSVNTDQLLPPSPYNIGELQSQFSLNCSVKLAVSEVGLPPLQSPVSPESTEWISSNFIGDISESPTATDFRVLSTFTGSLDSDVSLPSTRSSTMQSFSESSLAAGKSVDYKRSLPIMQDTTNEIPSDIIKDDVSSQWQASTYSESRFSFIPRSDHAYLSSDNWPTPNGLVRDFFKVLSLHICESAEKLKKPDHPAINELLSMTCSTIAFTGFDAWRWMRNGYSPITIVDLYSLTHIAYACAIVVYDGQIENQLGGLFTKSLSIATGSLSDEAKSIYTSIAWSTWSPPTDYLGLNPNGNIEILDVIDLFVDLFEGASLYSKLSSTAGNASYGLKDEKFIQVIENMVTTPLINAHFQPGPSLEAFIGVVREMEHLVSAGSVTTVHEVEVGLKCAGKSIAQSMELYGTFSSRVKESCNAASYQLHFDPSCPRERLSEVIKSICKQLEAAVPVDEQSSYDHERQLQSGADLGGSSLLPARDDLVMDNMLDNPVVDGRPQRGVSQARLYRRSAVKRKRSLSSPSCSTPETGLSSSFSGSPGTLSNSSDNENLSCSLCNFRPTGELKWHRRTMRRHLASHGPGNKKIFSCAYCESTFSRTDNRAAHIRTIHNRSTSTYDIHSPTIIGGIAPLQSAARSRL